MKRKYRKFKSIKMGADELGEKIKAAVKEALDEGKNTKDDNDADNGGSAGVDASDLQELIQEAFEMVQDKRKSKKDGGDDEAGDITSDEIMDAISEILGGDDDDADDEKSDGDDSDDDDGSDDSGDDDDENQKGHKSVNKSRQTKSVPAKQSGQSNKSAVSRKYANIFLNADNENKQRETKKIPPAIQLARAIKCLDVFGRQDPDAASYYAVKKYGDNDMAKEFKALNATSPTSGGYLIPEVYLDQIIELLYSKTVIFELGTQKVPMPNGNLNIPKMTGGARATWGGEQRKIPKSQPAYGNIRLSAKRLEAIVPQTRELLMSTNFSADQMFANDLTRRMQLGLDFGALFGSGSEFQPTGITKNKEIEKVNAKTLGNPDLSDSTGKITADFPVFVRSKVLAKNVDDLHLGWTFNSVMEGYFMNMKTTTGAYLYRDEMYTGKLLGFQYKTTNQIPTDTDGLTELVFGNWNDLLVGEQLGLETYTTLDGSWTDEDGNQHNAFEENLTATRALMYVDIAVRHAESFLHVHNVKAV